MGKLTVEEQTAKKAKRASLVARTSLSSLGPACQEVTSAEDETAQVNHETALADLRGSVNALARIAGHPIPYSELLKLSNERLMQLQAYLSGDTLGAGTS